MVKKTPGKPPNPKLHPESQRPFTQLSKRILKNYSKGMVRRIVQYDQNHQQKVNLKGGRRGIAAIDYLGPNDPAPVLGYTMSLVGNQSHQH